MEQLSLSESIDIKETGENQADIIIGPAYPGYGNTLGNSLRRVLLSSLPGAAVTAVKIKGVTHEFTTIPGVKEDMVQVILNLKKLRFKLHDTEETKVTLKASGDGKVTGKDISLTSEVTLSNTDLVIATISDKSATLEMELTIKEGRGYQPVENLDKKESELGVINVDAIFTPIRNVNYRVENVRVGQMTNYDRIILSVTTDGTITPEEAVRYAAQTLVDHFAVIAKHGDTTKPEVAAEKKEDTAEAVVEEKEEKPKKKRGRPKKSEESAK